MFPSVRPFLSSGSRASAVLLPTILSRSAPLRCPRGLSPGRDHKGDSRARYDLERPPGERLLALEIGGEPVEENRVYRSAANSFLAEGGDLYRTFTESPWIETIDRDVALVIIDFLKNQNGPVAAPVMGRLTPATEQIAAPLEDAAAAR